MLLCGVQNENGIFKYKILAAHRLFPETNETVLRIHPKTGVISVTNARYLDREKMSNVTFKVNSTA